MPDFLYPTSEELRAIAQDLLPSLQKNRRLFDFFPIRETRYPEIAWEQLDNYTGLAQARGLNGAPFNVKRTGAKKYVTQPGVYGEFTLLDEQELTRRRALGTFGPTMDATDLVAQEELRLMVRELDRIEQIGWTLVTAGTFSVSTPTGALVHTDTFPIQTFSAAVSWGTSATATPLADLMAVQLLADGHSVSFGADAIVYMNRVTSQSLLRNANPNDLFGKRNQGMGTFNTIGDINTLVTRDDLPNIVIYNNHYLDDSGTVQHFIPNNKAVVVGVRPDSTPVGEYVMTPNENSDPPGQPGSYAKIIDHGQDTVPRSIEVHRGHNGGPTILYPSAVVVMNV